MNNFTPVVVMPTRITDRSATLIDHIYYSDCSKHDCNDIITAGNLWCDITDHLPNFVFISNNKGKKYDYKTLPLVRLHSQKNIEKFVKCLKNTNWNDLYQYSNSNDAYNFLHQKISGCYEKSFKLVRLSRKCARDKMWVTQGIKKSSNYKNKLYKKWLCSHNRDDELRYKSYLTVFEKVIRAAQSDFYEERFDTRTHTIKELWINLNQISSLCKTRTSTSIMVRS